MAVNEGLHQLPPLCYPPSDSDDESFVVLERSLGPDSPRENDESVRTILSSAVIEESLDFAADALCQMNKSDLASAPEMPMLKSQFSVKSCDMTDNEIQEKVDMLISENNKLKETLFQNNVVMKTQFQTLKKWQEDVEKVHESHKEKFAQTKIYIENLLKEKKRLTDIVNSKDPGVELKLEASMKVESEIVKNLQLEKENEKLKLHIISLEESRSNVSEEFATKQQKYLEQITNLKFLNEKLKAYENCGEEINNLRRQLMEAQMSLTQMKSNFEERQYKYLDEIQNLKALNDKSSNCSIEEENQLRKQLLDTMSQLKEMENMKCDAETKSHTYLQKMNQLDELMKKMKIDYDTLTEKGHSNTTYVEEINNLKEKLKVSTESKEEVSKLRRQLMDAQMSLTQMKESKKAIETEAQANRNKINELEAKIKEFNRNNDRNVALENQLELYRADFEAERSSKEKLLQEKNEIVEDLRVLQNRNEQLINEVDTLRSKCTFVEVASAAASSVAQASAPPSPPPTTYSCPLCLEKFRSYKMVEEHVQLCINNSI